MLNIQNAKAYCSEPIENIENYEEALNDKYTIWHCHHKKEICEDGTRIYRPQLIEEGLYFNRPASELIFLTESEHRRIHMANRIVSPQTRRRLSESCIGRPSPNKGVPMSEEQKRKLSQARTGTKLSDDTKRKMSNSHKGQLWFNDGVRCVRCKECPVGFKSGRLIKTNQSNEGKES